MTSDRDAIEDAEFAALEAREAMPRAIADFREHPVYALERHLRRHEVVWPRKRVGTVSAGRGGLEDVFRRSDVKICKSGVKWYREGREVKEGEQPLKVVVPVRKNRRRDVSVGRDGAGDTDMDMDGEHAEEAGTNLYALHQTSLYEPPPAQHGRVPRNTFGNLDVYVRSMIPTGAVHVRAAEGAKAAKLLGIDYADAVTGFSFKSGGKGVGGARRGTAVTEGVVVAKEFAEGMRVTVDCLRWDVVREEEARRVRRVLGLWKKFLVGLRVLERLKVYDGDGGGNGEDGAYEDEDVGKMDVRERIEEVEKRERVKEMQGGFMPDVDAGGDTGMMHTGNDDSARDEDMTAAVNDIDGWNIGQNGSNSRNLDIEDLDMIVPSPWDRLDAARYAKTNATDMAKDLLSVQDHTDDLFGEDEGSGGFLPENDHHEQGGGFMTEADEKDGGGFLPDDGEGGGGGFVLEDTVQGDLAPNEPDAEPPRHGGVVNAVDDRKESKPVLAPGSQSAEASAIASTDTNTNGEDTLMSGALQGSEATITTQSQSHSRQANDEPIPADEPEAETQSQAPLKESQEKTTHDAPTMRPNNKSSDPAHESSAEEDDQRSQTSMLSHDPDDSDAEPEWL